MTIVFLHVVLKLIRFVLMFISIYTGHFIFWISFLLSQISTYTHRLQEVNYRGSSADLLFIIIILKQKE